MELNGGYYDPFYVCNNMAVVIITPPNEGE